MYCENFFLFESGESWVVILFNFPHPDLSSQVLSQKVHNWLKSFKKEHQLFINLLWFNNIFKYLTYLLYYDFYSQMASQNLGIIIGNNDIISKIEVTKYAITKKVLLIKLKDKNFERFKWFLTLTIDFESQIDRFESQWKWN